MRYAFLSELHRTHSTTDIKKLPVYGHLDVHTRWNQDDACLDTSVWSPDMGRNRLHFARSPAGKTPTFDDAATAWQKFSTVGRTGASSTLA